MKKFLIITLVVILLYILDQSVYAQTFPQVTLPNTEVRDLESKIVNSNDYKIYIWLPSEYTATADTLPVLYILDASLIFATMVETCIFLRSFNEIKPFILVGIAHENDYIRHRARDFTPTKLSVDEVKQKYSERMAYYTPESGQAPIFLEYLKEEVIPFVERNYRVSRFDRGIFGHSYGGLFVAYALFNEPELFNKYLISSSASWWDDDVVLKQEEVLRLKRNFLNASVLATVGTNEGPLIIGGWERLRDRLKSAPYKGFQFSSIQFEGESHASVPPIAYSKALRLLYRPTP